MKPLGKVFDGVRGANGGGGGAASRQRITDGELEIVCVHGSKTVFLLFVFFWSGFRGVFCESCARVDDSL